jgi:glycosyltransferase involved in cell wall biosynthesis
VLNGAAFLTEAIQSILTQTVADLELIVVDDGSDDGSQAITEAFARADRRVQLVRLARDPATASGARATNVGLELARGPYVARMDADDIAAPNRLAVQLRTLRARELDVCGGRAVRFGDRAGVIWYPQSHEAMAAELIFRAAFSNQTLLARAEVLKAARFSETEAYEEYELQTRLILQARLGNCSEAVVRIRFHPLQTTRVLHARKSASHWRSRFRYFFARFPDATLEDFRCVNAMPRRLPFADQAQLERAGRWLVRLSRLPEERLRARMARRWREACDRFFGPGAAPPVRAEVEAQILAPP